MADLNTRTKYVTGVFRLQKDISDYLIDSFDKYIKTVANEYYYIIHDKDVDKDGNHIPNHIHFVCNLISAVRLSTFINAIANSLGVSEFAFTVSKTINQIGSIRYLIHKDDEDKYQYDILDIFTNVSNDRLDEYINCVIPTKLDITTIVNICLNSDNLLDVIAQIGLNSYNMYRNVIKDIYTETRALNLKR